MTSDSPHIRTRTLVLVLAFASCQLANANPVGVTVVSGQVGIAQNAGTLSIQNSPNAILNWRSFSIGASEVTRFIQANSNSAVLNRVTGGDVSSLLGVLQSNGRVFLINPNGVVIGAGARIDTAGFVASSLDISNDDFVAGRYHFSGNAESGSVINNGTILGRNGNIWLFAPDVENKGLITTQGGQIVLAAGRSIIVGSSDLGDLQFVIQAPTDRAVNLGTLRADGGAVGMFASNLEQSGIIRADAIGRDAAGEIILRAANQADVGGSLSAQGMIGGNIQILGTHVGIESGADINASGASGGGRILVGGDWHGANPDVPNAQTTVVASGAQLQADATASGNGGQIVVWADQSTNFAGNISARGGPGGGNGGQVEVSGKQQLFFSGAVDTSAPLGTIGNLLLDPYDIFVVSGGGAQPALVANAALYPGNSLSIDPATLAAQNTSITLAAGHNITFDSPLALTGSSGLSATAANNLAVDAAIATASGNISLNAGNSLAVNSAITTAGGSIALTSGSNLGVNAALAAGGNINLSTGAGGINSSAGISSSSGSLTLTTSGAANIGGPLAAAGSVGIVGDLGVTLGSSLTSSGGNVNIQAPGGSISGSGTINTNNGSLTLGALQNIDFTSSADQVGTGTGSVGLTASNGSIAIGVHNDAMTILGLNSTGPVSAIAAGSVNIAADHSLNALSASGQSVGLYAQNNLVSGTVTSSSGDVNLATGTGTLTSNTVNASNSAFLSSGASLTSNIVNANAYASLSAGGTLVSNVVTANGYAYLYAVGNITPGSVSTTSTDPNTTISVASNTGSVIAGAVNNLLSAPHVEIDAGPAGNIGSTAAPIRTNTAWLDVDYNNSLSYAVGAYNIDNTGHPLSTLNVNAGQVGGIGASNILNVTNLPVFSLYEKSDSTFNPDVTGNVLYIAGISGGTVANPIAISVLRQNQPANTIQIADIPVTPAINLGGSSSISLNASSGDIQALGHVNTAISANSISLSGNNIGYFDGYSWSGPITAMTPNLSVSGNGFLVDDPMQLSSLSITTSASGLNSSGIASIGAPNLPTCSGPCIISTSGGELSLTAPTPISVSLPALNATAGFTGGFSLTLSDGNLSYSTITGNVSQTINSTALTNLFPGAVTLNANNGSLAFSGSGLISASGPVSLYASNGGSGTIAAGNINSGWTLTLSSDSTLTTGNINAASDVTTGWPWQTGISTGNITTGGQVSLSSQGDNVTGNILAQGNVTLSANGPGTIGLKTGSVTSSYGSVSLNGVSLSTVGCSPSPCGVTTNGAINAGGNITAYSNTFISLDALNDGNPTVGGGSIYLQAGTAITSSTPLSAPQIALQSGAALTLSLTTSNLSITADSVNSPFAIALTAPSLNNLSIETSGTAIGGGTSSITGAGNVNLTRSGTDIVVNSLAVPLTGGLTLTAASGGVQLLPGALSVGSGSVTIDALSGVGAISQTGAGTGIAATGSISLNAAGGIGATGSQLDIAGGNAITLSAGGNIGAPTKAVSISGLSPLALTATSGDQVYITASTPLSGLNLTLPVAGTAGAFGVTDPTGPVASFVRPASGPLALVSAGDSGNGSLGSLSIQATGSDLSVTGNINAANANLALSAPGGNLLFGGASSALSVNSASQTFTAANNITLDGTNFNVDVVSPGGQTLTAGGSILVQGGSGHAALTAGGGQNLTSTGGGDITLQGGTGNASYASVTAAGTQVLVSNGGDLSILGGSGNGAGSTLSGQVQNIATSGGNVLIQGGAATNAYASVFATNQQNVDSATGAYYMPGSLTLRGGTLDGAYALLAAGNGQVINAGASSLYGGNGSAASPAYALVSNGAGLQQITASGTLTLLSAMNGPSEIINNGSGQSINANAISISSPGGTASNTNARIVSGSDQLISSSGDIVLSNSTNNPAGIVGIVATNNQSLTANSLQVASSGNGTALVQAGANQTILLTGRTGGNSLSVDAQGAGSAASVLAGGDQSVAISDPLSGGAVKVVSTAGAGKIDAGGAQTIVADSLLIQAGTADGANAEVSSVGAQFVSTLLGGVSVLGGNGTSAGNYAALDPSSQTLTSTGPISVTAGSGNNATAAINAAGNQNLVSVNSGLSITGGPGNGSTAGVSAGGTQSTTVAGNVALTSGAGGGALATISGSAVNVVAGNNITIDASNNGTSSYAAITSSNGIVSLVAGNQLTLVQGSSITNSDAFVAVENGLGYALVSTGGGCTGCTLIHFDPITDPGNSRGFWATSFGPEVPVVLPNNDLLALVGIYDLLPVSEDDSVDPTQRRLPQCH